MTETPQLITGPDPSAQFWAAHREHRLIALHASGTTGMAHTIVRTTSSWVDSFAPPGHPDPEMGEATDLLAAKKQISRTRQDTYATTQQNGSFTAEIVPINDQVTDQRPRTFTAERLTRFRPIFRPGGSATTAGFCGINDGAVAVLMCDQGSYATRPKDRLPGLGQLRSGPPRLGHRPSHPWAASGAVLACGCSANSSANTGAATAWPSSPSAGVRGRRWSSNGLVVEQTRDYTRL